MNSPIRVAQILNNMDYGGVEAVIMNYYRNIDRSKIQFDFIINENSICPFQDEIEKFGGKIYKIPSLSKYLAYEKTLKKIFIENKYKIVHCHLSTLSVFPLRIAKKCNIPVRICHSHSTANPKEIVRSMIKYILRPFSKLYATDYFACGEYAGKWMFGKKASNKNKVFIMRNGIDSDKFKFNEKYREEIRNKYNVHDKFILGFIGRLVKQKNPIFLIKLLKEELKVKPNTILMIVGNGELKDAVIKKAKKDNVLDKIIFVDNTPEVFKYYSCFDVFVLPSLYEGLPVVGIEAQCNGVSSIFSNKMTDEILENENSVCLPLSVSIWKDYVFNLKTNRVAYDLEKYNITHITKILEDKYLSLYGVIR